MCIEKQKKKAVCVYSSTQTLCVRSRRLIPRSLLVCPAKRGKNARRRWKKMRWKIFFYCCGLFQAHQQRLLLPRLCRKKNLCTMDTHRFVCANFSHLFRREKREMKFAEKSKKKVSVQVEHRFDSGGRNTKLPLLRNFNYKDQIKIWLEAYVVNLKKINKWLMNNYLAWSKY